MQELHEILSGTEVYDCLPTIERTPGLRHFLHRHTLTRCHREHSAPSPRLSSFLQDKRNASRQWSYCIALANYLPAFLNLVMRRRAASELPVFNKDSSSEVFPIPYRFPCSTEIALLVDFSDSPTHTPPSVSGLAKYAHVTYTRVSCDINEQEDDERETVSDEATRQAVDGGSGPAAAHS